MEGVEAGLLDSMDELAGLARGGDVVVPAAGDVSLGIEAEDVRGDGIAMVVVVKEPAVNRGRVGGGRSEGGLDGFEIHEGIVALE